MAHRRRRARVAASSAAAARAASPSSSTSAGALVRRAGLGLLVVAAPLGALHAQEQSLPEVKVREAQDAGERATGPVQGYRATRSSTFTKTDSPLRETPASVTVVPEEVMRDTAMQSLADVFRYVPGATWHQGEGNRDQVVLRGNSTSADFYVDGVRDDAQVFRDLYNLERVEVLKGPGGMAFGRGGAGGVVNRVTKQPVFDRFAAGSVTAGSFGQLRGTADLNGMLGDGAAVRLNAMAETADSYRRGVGMNRFAINPTVALNPTDRTRVLLGYEHLEDDRTADRGIPSFAGRPYDTDRGTFFGNAGQSRATSKVDSLYSIVEHDFGGGVTLRNHLRATRYDKFYQNVYPGSAVDASGNLSLSAYNNANLRTNVFNQTDVVSRFRTGAVEHTLLTGVELGHQRSANKRNTGFFGASTSALVSATAPWAEATSFRPNGTDADNLVRSDTAAAYVQDQVAFSPRWKVIAGLRYDRFRTEFDDRRTTVTPTDLSRTDAAFSPRLGLVWTPTPAQTYYVSYSYAFLPSAETLGLATTTADLAPEKARNYEAGARWDVLPRLTLGTAVFRTDRDDVRVADPANPGFFVKTGQLRTDGAEISLQGNVTSRWQIYGGYANLDGRVMQPITSGTTASAASVTPAGNRIGLVPQHALALWNKVRIGAGVDAGLGIIRQSDMYTSFTNTVKLPAFTRFDGALFYTLPGTTTRVALNVENLLDKKYYPTADGDNNITPGAPRTYRVTVSMLF